MCSNLLGTNEYERSLATNKKVLALSKTMSKFIFLFSFLFTIIFEFHILELLINSILMYS